jgi:putative transposase
VFQAKLDFFRRPRCSFVTVVVPSFPYFHKMLNPLRRYYGAGYLHSITFSCYRRRPLLGEGKQRDRLLQILEQVRRSYRFVVVGYVAMPEHVHLLIGEPERANPSIVIQVLKQRFARQRLRAIRRKTSSTQGMLWKAEEAHVWQRRFYDFVVWTERKRVEKLRYIHRNPVKRGLVLEPEQWKWSSYRYYAFGERGPVLVNEQVSAKPAAMTCVGKQKPRGRGSWFAPFENREGCGSPRLGLAGGWASPLRKMKSELALRSRVEWFLDLREGSTWGK